MDIKKRGPNCKVAWLLTTLRWRNKIKFLLKIYFTTEDNMSGFQMVRPPDCRSHLKSRPFATQILHDHLKSRQVWISDPNCILLVKASNVIDAFSWFASYNLRYLFFLKFLFDARLFRRCRFCRHTFTETFLVDATIDHLKKLCCELTLTHEVILESAPKMLVSILLGCTFVRCYDIDLPNIGLP